MPIGAGQGPGRPGVAPARAGPGEFQGGSGGHVTSQSHTDEQLGPSPASSAWPWYPLMTQKMTSVVIWKVRSYPSPDYPHQNPGPSLYSFLSPLAPEARGDDTQSSVAWPLRVNAIPYPRSLILLLTGNTPRQAFQHLLAMPRVFERVLGGHISATSSNHLTSLFFVPFLEHWRTEPYSSLPLPTSPHGQVPGLAIPSL